MYSDLRSGQRDDHWLHRKLCEGRFLFCTVTANSRSTLVNGKRDFLAVLTKSGFRAG